MIMAEITKAKPRQLLVIADGTRGNHPHDVEWGAASIGCREELAKRQRY